MFCLLTAALSITRYYARGEAMPMDNRSPRYLFFFRAVSGRASHFTMLANL